VYEEERYICVERSRSSSVFVQSPIHQSIIFETFKLPSQLQLKILRSSPTKISYQIPRPNFHSKQLNMSSQNQSSKPYAESTYSTSTTYSEKPLMSSSASEKPASKRSKVWQKTKELLAKIPEPEREQKPAVVGPETEEEQLKRLRKFGELDYGTYQGGPYSGHVWSR
jgi:hypothetical protein